MLAFRDRLFDAYVSEDFRAWLTGFDRSDYERLRVTGFTHEAALVEIARKRAKAEMREENEKVLDQARQHMDIAAQMERNANRVGATRFTRDNPHPNSVTAMQKAARLHAVTERRDYASEEGENWDGLLDHLPTFEEVDK